MRCRTSSTARARFWRVVARVIGSAMMAGGTAYLTSSQGPRTWKMRMIAQPAVLWLSRPRRAPPCPRLAGKAGDAPLDRIRRRTARESSCPVTIAWPVVMRASVLRLVDRAAREVALTACRAEARTGPDHAAPAHESQRPSARMHEGARDKAA